MSKDQSKGYVLSQEMGQNPMVKGALWVDVTIRFHYTPKAQHDSNPMEAIGELPGLGTVVRLVEVPAPIKEG